VSGSSGVVAVVVAVGDRSHSPDKQLTTCIYLDPSILFLGPPGAVEGGRNPVSQEQADSPTTLNVIDDHVSMTDWPSISPIYKYLVSPVSARLDDPQQEEDPQTPLLPPRLMCPSRHSGEFERTNALHLLSETHTLPFPLLSR